jgi:hypothetical protein
MRGGEDRSWSDTEGMTMENEILITVIFVVRPFVEGEIKKIPKVGSME